MKSRRLNKEEKIIRSGRKLVKDATVFAGNYKREKQARNLKNKIFDTGKKIKNILDIKIADKNNNIDISKIKKLEPLNIDSSNTPVVDTEVKTTPALMPISSEPTITNQTATEPQKQTVEAPVKTIEQSYLEQKSSLENEINNLQKRINNSENYKLDLNKEYGIENDLKKLTDLKNKKLELDNKTNIIPLEEGERVKNRAVVGNFTNYEQNKNNIAKLVNNSNYSQTYNEYQLHKSLVEDKTRAYYQPIIAKKELKMKELGTLTANFSKILTSRDKVRIKELEERNKASIERMKIDSKLHQNLVMNYAKKSITPEALEKMLNGSYGQAVIEAQKIDLKEQLKKAEERDFEVLKYKNSWIQQGVENKYKAASYEMQVKEFNLKKELEFIKQNYRGQELAIKLGDFNLSKDKFNFEKAKLAKTINDEIKEKQKIEKEKSDIANEIIISAQHSINEIDTLLEFDDKGNIIDIGDGLQLASGWAHEAHTPWTKDARNDSLAKIQQIIGGQTFNKIMEAKRNGAGLGVLSNSDIKLLAQTANSIGAAFKYVDDNPEKPIEYIAMSEKELKRNLLLIRSSFERLKEVSATSSQSNDIDRENNDIDFLNNYFKPSTSKNTSYSDVMSNGYDAGRSQNKQSSVNFKKILDSIANVESRGAGNYQARGPVVKSGMYKGERALGRYQVMPGNLPQWSREAGINHTVTPQEFLNSPQIQDRIASAQFQKNIKKYGTVNDAVAVWFSGRPLKGNTAKDGLGTSTPEYIRKFERSYLS